MDIVRCGKRKKDKLVSFSLKGELTAEPVSSGTKFSGTDGDREIFLFFVQLTTSRVGTLPG